MSYELIQGLYCLPRHSLQVFSLTIPKIVIFFSFVQIEKSGDLNCVDVKSVLINMRSYRMGLIQTPDQLRFSYIAIIEGGKRILSGSSPSTVNNVLETYMNMKVSTCRQLYLLQIFGHLSSFS